MGPFCPGKVSTRQLQCIAQKRGVKLTKVFVNWATLQTQLSHPVLLVLKNGNVVLALRRDDHSNNHIVVFDPLYPTGQDFLLPQEVLESAWDGNAILVDRRPAEYNLLARFASAIPTFITVLGLIVFWPTITGEEYYIVTPVHTFQQLSPEASAIAESTLYILPNTGTQHEPLSLGHRPAVESRPAITVPAKTGPDLSEIVSASASNPFPGLAIPKPGVDADPPNGEGIRARGASGAIRLEQIGRDSELHLPELQTFAPPARTGLAAAAGGSEKPVSIASALTSELSARSEAIVFDASGVEDTVTAPGHSDSSRGAPEISALMARGDALFGMGDLASARLFYERAADAGHGQAALRLGESYDPSFLALNGIPVHGDSALAARWYKRAIELGVPASDILLDALER